MKKVITILIICLFTALKAQQTAYKEVKEGNKAYADSSFQKAELSYRKGIDINTKAPIPQYNLGNSKYAQKDFEAAAKQYETSAALFENKTDKASAYHNKGNALLEQNKYEESIAEYKKALKLIPNDLDTKYNLAYAQEKLKKEQQQQQQQQQQDQDQDQNKDQEEKEEKKDEENKEPEKDKDKEEGDKEEDKKDGDKKEEQDNSTKKPGELSKEEAEQMLNAIDIKEGKLKEKIDKDKEENIIISTDKDW